MRHRFWCLITLGLALALNSQKTADVTIDSTESVQTTSGNEVLVSISTSIGNCLLVVVNNGMQVICAEDKDEVFELTRQAIRFRRDVAYFLVNRDSKRILMADRLTSPGEAWKEPPGLRVIWPKANNVVTSNTFDVHFFGTAPINDHPNVVCARAQVESALVQECVASNASIVPLTLPHGKHRILVFQTENLTTDTIAINESSYTIVDVEVSVHPQQAEVFIGPPHAFLSQQFSEWILDDTDRKETALIHILFMSARSYDR